MQQLQDINNSENAENVSHSRESLVDEVPPNTLDIVENISTDGNDATLLENSLNSIPEVNKEDTIIPIDEDILQALLLEEQKTNDSIIVEEFSLETPPDEDRRVIPARMPSPLRNVLVWP